MNRRFAHVGHQRKQFPCNLCVGLGEVYVAPVDGLAIDHTEGSIRGTFISVGECKAGVARHANGGREGAGQGKAVFGKRKEQRACAAFQRVPQRILKGEALVALQREHKFKFCHLQGGGGQIGMGSGRLLRR